MRHIFSNFHDVSFIFSDLLGNTKPQFSIFILLHNMFQPSGPDHMLNKTGKVLNDFHPLPSPESESQFKTKLTILEFEISKVLLTINLLPNILKKCGPSGAKSLASVAPSSSSLRTFSPLWPLLHQLKETKSRGTSALVTQKWNQL